MEQLDEDEWTSVELELLALGNALKLLRVLCATALKRSAFPQLKVTLELGRAKSDALLTSLLNQKTSTRVGEQLAAPLPQQDLDDLSALLTLQETGSGRGLQQLIQSKLLAIEEIAGGMSPEDSESLFRALLVPAIARVQRQLQDDASTSTPTAERVGLGRRRMPLTSAGTSIDVWFGTNRKPIYQEGRVVNFSGERDQVVLVGRCSVSIPYAHRIGSVGSPWWRRLLSGDDRIALTAVEQQEQQSFWNEIQQRLATLASGSGDALIFIHGFNVSFDEAAIRTAQIGADLGFQGWWRFSAGPLEGGCLAISLTKQRLKQAKRQSPPSSRTSARVRMQRRFMSLPTAWGTAVSYAPSSASPRI